jgi:hypothetical protein
MEMPLISQSPTFSQTRGSIESEQIVRIDVYGMLAIDQSQRFGLSCSD